MIATFSSFDCAESSGTTSRIALSPAGRQRHPRDDALLVVRALVAAGLRVNWSARSRATRFLQPPRLFPAGPPDTRAPPRSRPGFRLGCVGRDSPGPRARRAVAFHFAASSDHHKAAQDVRAAPEIQSGLRRGQLEIQNGLPQRFFAWWAGLRRRTASRRDRGAICWNS